MKVAILAFYVMDSTIPLAKHISSEGVDVDLYSLLPHSNQNTFVFDFLSNPQKNGFVSKIILKENIDKKLLDYMSGLNLQVYIYPTERAYTLLSLDFYYAYKLATHIKKRKYDLIHIIHNSSKRFWSFLYFFLKDERIIQTLHEVTSHESKTSKDTIHMLEFLIKNSIPIIFNSEISKQRFIDFLKKSNAPNYATDNLAMVRFGLYETYHCFSEQLDEKTGKEELHILNFGRIVPYKGIHILIEAVKILQDKYPIHLVIAGMGEPYFNFDNIENYEFINRFYSNEEAVKMIENSDIVVLPYISGSQSGIPMTVFAFNKPIIASNIAGFKEVIDNLETGILVDNLAPNTLASSIEIILKNRVLLKKMSENIKKKYSEGEFSWQFIAKNTISFYNERLKAKNKNN